MSAAKPLPVAFHDATLPVTFAHFEVPDASLVGAGVLAGDTAVVLLDCEVTGGDLVLVHTPEGLRVLQYHPAPGGRVKLQTLNFGRSRKLVYEAKDAVILGRVVQFQSGGAVVQTLINLRPVC